VSCVFASLTPSSYHGILDRLRSPEWREVRDRLAGRSFQCDIVGSLPVEIVARVVAELDLWEIVSLQRVGSRRSSSAGSSSQPQVSRRWCELLSSSHIYRTALRHREDPSQSAFAHRARQRLVLEHGRPYSKAQHASQFACISSRSPADVMSYCRGKIAWVHTDPDGRSLAVAVRCLRSGTDSHFYLANREPILFVRLSDRLVIAITIQA
jgi:hypothetical protein